ncbi:hypothetical protein D9M68_439050 [compost metagenome]
MDVGQPLGIGVAGHHDVRLLGQQGLEGVEELFLRAVLVGEELHVVDQQQIERVVAFLELIESLALIGLDHIRHELLGVDVENFGIGPVGQQPVTHSVHQVGLAQADAAVDEKRVVQVARHAGHVHGRGARHAVGRALDQGVEREPRIEPVLEAGGRRFLARAGHVARHIRFGHDGHGRNADGGFSRSER